MNDLQRGLIALIKSALKGEAYELPEGFSPEAVVDIAKNHQISPIVYYGAIKCGFDKTSDGMKKLFENAFPLVLLDEEQNAALNKLSNAFEKEEIEYMPLKGSVLKALYPKSEMRVMGDIDILIKPEQYESIKKIMSDSGFDENVESDHEFIWTRGNLCIELHKRLVPSYHKDYYAYFGDGWKFAEKTKTTKCFLKSEVEYSYLFTHFAKHYRSGGIGIKHLVDLWVYKNARPSLDWECVKRELARLRLDKFFENVEKTLEVWFEGEEETSETKLISETIFGSGAYGEQSAVAAATLLRESAGKKSVAATKRSRFFKLIFLPYKHMCEKYSFLGKYPFLLPFMWVVRLFNIIVFRRNKISNYMDEQKQITSDEVFKQKEKLNAVGLDFYTEEDVL